MSAAEPTEERGALDARQKRHGQGYAAIVWAQLEKNRPGMIGLVFVLLIVTVAVLAPLLANDRPIAIAYRGATYFPAFTGYVDAWVPWRGLRSDLKSLQIGDGFPFSDHYPILEGRSWKEAAAQDTAGVAWALWPPVRWNPKQFDRDAIKKEPSSAHTLGTDDQGRDVFARVLHGCVVAVTVGVIAMGVAATIGVTLGVTAGYFGGKIDLVLGRIVEIVMCFPTFFLIIAIISFLPPSIVNIMLVIGFVSWTGVFRLIRGEVLRNKNLDYVMAARALGIPTRRIMFRQLLPNSVAPVFVSVAFGIAGAVLIETTLSFLGFGDISVPSWGEIVSQGRQYVAEGLTHLVVWPGIAIFVTLTAFNLFGQGLRDAMDPRLRR